MFWYSEISVINKIYVGITTFALFYIYRSVHEKNDDKAGFIRITWMKSYKRNH